MNPSWHTLLRIAAPAAVFKWADSEKNSVEEIKKAKPINEDILFRWLKQWNLSRTIPVKKDGTRRKLANFLEEISKRLQNEEIDFSQKIKCEAESLQKKLKKECCIKSKQTSLMSKFAFSLYPEVAAPYDQYALRGLCMISASNVRSHLEHEYPAYFCKFNEFAAECGDELDKSCLTKSLQPLWKPIMSKTIFKRRTADKLLMFLGLLQVNRNNDAQRMEVLQAWINPSLLVGIYICQWKNRQDVDNHLKDILEELAVLCNETPESMKEQLNYISARFVNNLNWS